MRPRIPAAAESSASAWRALSCLTPVVLLAGYCVSRRSTLRGLVWRRVVPALRESPHCNGLTESGLLQDRFSKALEDFRTSAPPRAPLRFSNRRPDKRSHLRQPPLLSRFRRAESRVGLLLHAQGSQSRERP